jgi:hypothetical protein
MKIQSFKIQRQVILSYLFPSLVKAAEVMLLSHGKWHPAWQPPVLLLDQFEQGTQLPYKQNSYYF